MGVEHHVDSKRNKPQRDNNALKSEAAFEQEHEPEIEYLRLAQLQAGTSAGIDPEAVLYLQRTIGNQATMRLLQERGLMPNTEKDPLPQAAEPVSTISDLGIHQDEVSIQRRMETEEDFQRLISRLLGVSRRIRLYELQIALDNEDAPLTAWKKFLEMMERYPGADTVFSTAYYGMTWKTLIQRQIVQLDSREKLTKVEEVEGGIVTLSEGKEELIVDRTKLWIQSRKDQTWHKANYYRKSWGRNYEGKKCNVAVDDQEFSAILGPYGKTIKVTKVSEHFEFIEDTTPIVEDETSESIDWSFNPSISATQGTHSNNYRYQVNTLLEITPMTKPLGCDEIGFLQIERAVNPVTGESAHGSASKEQLERETKKHVSVDRTKGSYTPFYGVRKEGLKYFGTSRNTVWKSDAGGSKATLEDTPEGNGNWSALFKSFVVCLKGYRRGLVFGYVEWGFIGLKNGKVIITEQPRFVKSKATEDLSQAAANWNKQAVERRNKGEKVEFIPTLT